MCRPGTCFEPIQIRPLKLLFGSICNGYDRAMITRRDSLAGSIAFLCELVVAHAQTRNGTTEQQFQRGNGAVFKHDLPNLTMEDWEVTVSYVDYPPGRAGQTHHHAGFVLAYVLEGAIITKISGQEERTYRTGEMFFSRPGARTRFPITPARRSRQNSWR